MHPPKYARTYALVGVCRLLEGGNGTTSYFQAAPIINSRVRSLISIINEVTVARQALEDLAREAGGEQLADFVDVLERVR